MLSFLLVLESGSRAAEAETYLDPESTIVLDQPQAVFLDEFLVFRLPNEVEDLSWSALESRILVLSINDSVGSKPESARIPSGVRKTGCDRPTLSRFRELSHSFLSSKPTRQLAGRVSHRGDTVRPGAGHSRSEKPTRL